MTNTTITNEIINGYRMDNNKINTEYFADQVVLHGINTEALTEALKNNRIKPLSIAKNWLCSYINFELKNHGYKNYVCTYPQIKKALADQLEEIEKIVSEYVEAEREEYKN